MSQAIIIATLEQAANTPTSSGPTFAGVCKLYQVLPDNNPEGGGWQSPQPLGSAPVYHADTTTPGPALAARTPVVLGLSSGGHYYIVAAPGYTGLTAAAVAGQTGFSAF